MEQGVRQGDIISTDFYKVHLNPLLYRIQYSGLGARIGNITCNLIGCVDDLAVNTNDRREGQTLVNSSTDLSEQKYKYLQVLAFQKSWRSFSPITVCIIAQCQCRTGGGGGGGARAPHEEANFFSHIYMYGNVLVVFGVFWGVVWGISRP